MSIVVYHTMKIAFVCTGNSARSQMAEGFAKKFAELTGIKAVFYSAGSEPADRVNPLAVEVMKEKGIDISSHIPKGLGAIPYRELNLVVTLCDDARQTCPTLPGVKMIHWGLQDPASFEGSETEKLEFFRRIRDEIEERVWDLLQSLQLERRYSIEL